MRRKRPTDKLVYFDSEKKFRDFISIENKNPEDMYNVEDKAGGEVDTATDLQADGENEMGDKNSPISSEASQTPTILGEQTSTRMKMVMACEIVTSNCGVRSYLRMLRILYYLQMTYVHGNEGYIPSDRAKSLDELTEKALSCMDYLARYKEGLTYIFLERFPGWLEATSKAETKPKPAKQNISTTPQAVGGTQKPAFESEPTIGAAIPSTAILERGDERLGSSDDVRPEAKPGESATQKEKNSGVDDFTLASKEYEVDETYHWAIVRVESIVQNFKNLINQVEVEINQLLARKYSTHSYGYIYIYMYTWIQ